MFKIFAVILLVATPLFGQWEIIKTDQKRELDEIFFVDSLHGWSVGEKGTILASVDGGKLWTKYNPGIKTDLQTVKFINPETGWAAGKKGVVISTNDGGKTWQEYNVGIKTSIKSVCFVDENNGWLCGKKEAVIYNTSDGGKTWIQQYKDDEISGFARIKFTDTKHGWCVGDKGTLLRTTDGKTWQKLIVDTKKDLSAIWFEDSDYGYVGGKSGKIFHTSDGGKTWQNQTTYTVDEIEAITFANKEVGWAAGDEGQILFTLNGGKKWIMQKTPVTHDLKHLFFLDENLGWACGVSPFIIRTSNGGGIRPEVDRVESEGADKVTLNQNYPNPFNPDTKISFSVPSKMHVSLKIFDIVGNEIAVLLKKDMEKGKYTVNFSAYELLSGIYFYTLEAGEERITKKMTLIK